MGGLSRRRTVVSVSLSAANPDAVAVSEALTERGIVLTRSGAQILAWAAAYLSGQPATSLDGEAAIVAAFGMTTDQIEACLDDF